MSPAINKRRYLSINLTNHCQLRCRFCAKGIAFAGTRPSEGPSIAMWRRFVEKLTEMYKGTWEIDLSGGEPLLHPDAIELIALMKEFGHRVTVCSNGFAINPALARRLGSSGLDTIALSLDSIDPKIHDLLRGRKGSYLRVHRAIKHLSVHAKTTTIGIHTVLCGVNLDRIEELLLTLHCDPKIDYCYLQALSRPLDSELAEDWYLESEYRDLWPDTLKVNASLERIIAGKINGRYSKIGNPIGQLRLFQRYFKNPLTFAEGLDCAFDRFSLNIFANGDVQVYHGIEGPIGNIADPDLKNLFERLERSSYVVDATTCSGIGHILLNCFPDRVECDLPTITQKLDRLTLATAERPIEDKLDLRFCSIKVAQRCNARCRMCFYWKEKEEPYSIALEHLQRFFIDLNRIVTAPFQVQLIGGEPLLNPDLMAIIEMGRCLGLLISFPTSGLPFDEPTIAAICKARPFTVSLSIDSANPRIHDHLRGCKGLFEQAMGGIREIRKREPGVTIDILTTLMRPNIEAIGDLVDFVEDEPAIDKIYFQTLAQPFMGEPCFAGWEKQKKYAWLWPDNHSMIDRCFDILIERRKGPTKISNSIGQLEFFRRYYLKKENITVDKDCDVGDFSVVIGPTGQASLCSWEPKYLIGSIVETSFYDLWYCQKAAKVRREIAACKRNCHFLLNCYFSS